MSILLAAFSLRKSVNLNELIKESYELLDAFETFGKDRRRGSQLFEIFRISVIDKYWKFIFLLILRLMRRDIIKFSPSSFH